MSVLTDCPIPIGEILTVTNRTGRECLATFYGEDFAIWVFRKSQRPKAEALVRKCGPDWEVITLPSGTGFIVARKTASEVQGAA